MQKKVAATAELYEETASILHRRFAAVMWVLLIGLGSAFVATFAAATQLWEYPLPRSLLLKIAWSSAVACAHAACAYLVFDNTNKHSYSYSPKLSAYWKAGAFLFGFYLFGQSIWAFSDAFSPLVALLDCANQLTSTGLCNIKAEGVTPSIAEEMRKLFTE